MRESSVECSVPGRDACKHLSPESHASNTHLDGGAHGDDLIRVHAPRRLLAKQLPHYLAHLCAATSWGQKQCSSAQTWSRKLSSSAAIGGPSDRQPEI